MPKENKNWVRALSDALNMGTTMVAAIAIGYFAGRWLDGKFDTEPWLTLLGFLLGLITAMKTVYERMNRDSKK